MQQFSLDLHTHTHTCTQLDCADWWRNFWRVQIWKEICFCLCACAEKSKRRDAILDLVNFRFHIFENVNMHALVWVWGLHKRMSYKNPFHNSICTMPQSIKYYTLAAIRCFVLCWIAAKLIRMSSNTPRKREKQRKKDKTLAARPKTGKWPTCNRMENHFTGARKQQPRQLRHTKSTHTIFTECAYL